MLLFLILSFFADWLVDNYPLSRDGAVQFCCAAEQRNRITRVSSRGQFRDDHLLFRWSDPNKKGVVDQEKEKDDEDQEKEEATEEEETDEMKGKEEREEMEEREVTSKANREQKIYGISLLCSLLCALFCWLCQVYAPVLALALLSSLLAWKIGSLSIQQELSTVRRHMAVMEQRIANLNSGQRVANIEPERDIKMLIKKHKNVIDSVKRRLGSKEVYFYVWVFALFFCHSIPFYFILLFDVCWIGKLLKEELDDLFLLRYVLSFKNASSVVEAICKASEWRKENSHFFEEDKELPQNKTIQRFCVMGIHKKPLSDGSPMLVSTAMF